MPPTPPGRRLHLVSLEARDVPSTVTSGVTFDSAKNYTVPDGWKAVTTHHTGYFAVSPRAALSGGQALLVAGKEGVESAFYDPTPRTGDVALGAAVRADAPAPVGVQFRGLDGNAGQYTAVTAAVVKGGGVQIQAANGTTETVAAEAMPVTPLDPKTWVRVGLTIVGTTAEVTLQRADTGQFLTPGGAWQSTPVVAARAENLPRPTVGLAAIARTAGAGGAAFVDDLDFGPASPAVSVTPAPVVIPPASNGVTAEVPQKYDHIRIAQLAYSATPVGDTELSLLRNSTDLVVSNPKFLGQFDAAAPDTPQTVYTNVSNLYGDLLTDWLGYAAGTGAEREAAFYHVSEATAFSGDSPSSQPVTWPWSVARGGATAAALTDETSDARGRSGNGVPFGATGDVLAVGFPDRFRELNVKLTKAATGSYAVVWEYYGTGGWKPLSIQTDGTNGLKADGTLVFDPPADWRANALNGKDPLFTVRARIVAGTAAEAPTARSILGKDYVNANGTTKGTIPAFDAAADADDDGYLNDAEYAARKAGADARFVHESRLFYPYYGQMRFVLNPANDAVKAWAADYHQRLLADTPLADGLFLDNSNGKAVLNGAKTVESSAAHPTEYADLVAAVRAAAGSKVVISNTAGARAEANPVADAAGIAFEEFLIRSNDASWQQVLDAKEIVDMRLANADAVILDTHPGSANPDDPRTELGTLAYYYLLADPSRTYLMMNGGFSPSAAWGTKWTAAATVNVGKPTGAMTVYATGKDPANAALDYRVYGRTYENALSLYKPKSYLRGVGTGTTADSTATTHDLGGKYRAVQADGTLGGVVTSITLRGGEGAVLIKVDRVGEAVGP